MSDSESAAFEAFLASVGNKDRLNIQRHLAILDAEAGPGHGRLWRRVAVALRKLAPMPVQTVGQQIVQFFVPDGKYRMQVFTLEDKRDGTLLVYLPDVRDEAVKAKVLGKPPASAKPARGAQDADGLVPVEYPIPGKNAETLRIEALDNTNTPEPPQHVRHMLGWNRKALRVTIPVIGAPAQAAALEALCAIAARAWTADAADEPKEKESKDKESKDKESKPAKSKAAASKASAQPAKR